jgi:predicted  nucleic acid-binding Zn-ribbon protein
LSIIPALSKKWLFSGKRMADQFELLKQLQVLDGELFRLRKAAEDRPRELEAAAAKVAEQEEKLKAAEGQVKVLQLAQKEKEIELQTREAQVKKLQGQLFQIKTNKEYTAMQHEIDSHKADNSLLEEAILKTFDAIDQAIKGRAEQEQRVAKEQAWLRQERERIQGELDTIRGQIAGLESSRATLIPAVPPESLAVYERVLQIRDGLAMVPVLNDACGGCYRRLPPQVINQVYMKATLVTCESCNRILYFDETHSKL